MRQRWIRARATVCAGVLTLFVAACTASTDPEPSETGSSRAAETSETSPASPSPSESALLDPGSAAAGRTPGSTAPDDAAPPGSPEPPTRGGSDGRTPVRPQVAYAAPGLATGTLEVAAFIPDVIEADGTCAAQVSGLPDTRVEAPAFADASSTSCGLLVLDVTPTSGQTVVVTYESPRSAGSSEPSSVAVP